MKLIKLLRFFAFLLVFLTSIPLVIHFFSGSRAGQPFIIHAHVYAGILLLVLAPMLVITEKKRPSKPNQK